jgi:hypothetical protein
VTIFIVIKLPKIPKGAQISWRLRIWQFSKFFAAPEWKFSFKTAFGVICTAAPALIPQLEVGYADWKAEWVSITVLSV